MLKGQDIPVLMRVATSNSPDWQLQEVAADLDLSPSAVHRSVNRLIEAGLVDPRKRRIKAPQAHEFLSHGLRYVFPAKFSGETRGIRTAWAAEPLKSQLAPSRSLPPVWPDPVGGHRGIALQPVHPAVLTGARSDPRLAEGLALVDAVRAGDARTRALAATELRKWLSE